MLLEGVRNISDTPQKNPKKFLFQRYQLVIFCLLTASAVRPARCGDDFDFSDFLPAAGDSVEVQSQSSEGLTGVGVVEPFGFSFRVSVCCSRFAADWIRDMVGLSLCQKRTAKMAV